MNLTNCVCSLAATILCAVPAFAAPESFVIEPDSFADGTVLNSIHPRVDLAIHDGIQRPDFPEGFGVFPDPTVIPVTVLTNEDIFRGYFTSTGTKTFGHGGIGFTTLSRSLGLRFHGPANEVSIDVISSTDLLPTVGMLVVYDAAGELLKAVTSPELLRQEVSTLSITRPGFDIAFARAYSSDGHSQFGRFDNLHFTSVPEPSTALLLLTAALARLAFRRVANARS